MSAIGSWLSRQPAPLLGLDISASSVKLVELGRDRRGRHVLERCVLEPLQPGWVIDGSVERFDEVAQAIARAVRASGSRTRQVAMALPSSAVITKTIVLPPGLTETELEAQVQAEASQYIPFSLEEVSLDFCVAGPSAVSPGDVEVLIAASRRDRVLDRQALAEAAGLQPRVLDVETFAARLAADHLLSTLPGAVPNTAPDTAPGTAPGTWSGTHPGTSPGTSPEAVVALFELGSNTSSLQILRGGELLYDSDPSFGGALLTQQVARHYGLSLEDAEARKCRGDLPPDYAAAVLGPFVDTLAQEVVRSLQFFFASTAHARVDLVLLAGGSAALPGLPEAVAGHAACPCLRVNPFHGMVQKDARRGPLTRSDAPAFLTACGLALRRFHA